MSVSRAQSTMMRSKKKEGNLKPSRKLDRKSSRGVMFENEGLRLRTIEINAEVERGQSDLRKLRRENETLKQQVWTLRDEYDKLENLVKGIDDEPRNKNEGAEEEEDEDNDGDIDEKNKRKGSRRNKNYNDHERDDADDADDDDDDDELVEPDAENENLENLQKMYSGKMQSVEYRMRQAGGSSMEEGSMYHNPYAERRCSVVSENPPGTGHACSSSASEQRLCIGPRGDPKLSGSKECGPPESYVYQSDHFNLDQLLDFASSFHYDRRKHMKEEEPTVTVTLPSDEEKPGSPVPESEVKDDNDSLNESSSYPTIKRTSGLFEDPKQSSNTSSTIIKEVNQAPLCPNNEVPMQLLSQPTEVTTQATTVTYTRSSYYFSSSFDGGRSQSLGTGLNTTSSPRTPATPVAPLFSSSSATNIPDTSVSVESGLPLVSVYQLRAPPLVRLNSIEPNTLMISVSEVPQLWDITTQEIIDELEQQIEPRLSDIRGVRVASRAAYISLGRRETLEQLISNGLNIRGISVPLIDITRESIVVALSGVPHYIADATLSILLSAFGTIVGEIERRFYKGVDTGERFVRMKVKKHVKLPKYVTVGGCRIVLGVHNQENPVSVIHDWTHLPAHSMPTTPHQPSQSNFPHDPLMDEIPSQKTSPEKGQCLDVSSKDNLCEKDESSRTQHHLRTPADNRDSIKSGKTFSSRCVVNLKVPERRGSVNNPRTVPHREAPSPPCGSGLAVGIGSIPNTIGVGQVMRVGSLGCGKKNSICEGSTTSGGTVIETQPTNPNRRSRHSSQESTRSRPSSVTINEKPREGPKPVPPPRVPPIGGGPSIGPFPLANGILRKASVPEQEALLPAPRPISATATIKNRLKLGRSMSYDAGKKQTEKDKKKKKRLGKMESISENTISEDISDMTPLRTRSSSQRRDSVKSSVSANSKNSNNKGKKEAAIDLPWCGCWGNGCF